MPTSRAGRLSVLALLALLAPTAGCGDDAPAAPAAPRAAPAPEEEETLEEEEELEEDQPPPLPPSPDPVAEDCRQTDFDSDPAHCGGCQQACRDTQVCTRGRCAAACDEGLTACGRRCVDTKAAPGSCGRCDRVCAGEPCDEGFCRVALSQCFEAGPTCAQVCAAEGGRAEGFVRRGEMLDLAAGRSAEPDAVTYVSIYGTRVECVETPWRTRENDEGRTLDGRTDQLQPNVLRCPCTFDPPASWSRLRPVAPDRPPAE